MLDHAGFVQCQLYGRKTFVVCMNIIILWQTMGAVGKVASRKSDVQFENFLVRAQKKYGVPGGVIIALCSPGDCCTIKVSGKVSLVFKGVGAAIV